MLTSWQIFLTVEEFLKLSNAFICFMDFFKIKVTLPYPGVIRPIYLLLNLMQVSSFTPHCTEWDLFIHHLLFLLNTS